MPLQRKCESCGRTLVLEDVFQGAYCRCKHCRRLVEVPQKSASGRQPTSRPVAPPRASRPHSHQIEALPSGRGAPVRPNHASIAASLRSRLTLLRVTASAAIVGCAMLGFVIWTMTDQPSGRYVDPYSFALNEGGSSDDAESKREILASENPRLAIARSDPLRSYFGIPLQGQVIGYVIDCDATMAPYIDKLALITNSVSLAIDRDVVRFGIVQAVENPGGARVAEVLEPTTHLAGARTMLHGGLAAGRTDLPQAFAITEGWYADELFLVLSKSLPPADVDYLTQLAQQTGAVTHVIAFGAAAQDEDLARIADATHGQFVPVPDDALDALAARHEAIADPSR